MSGYINFNETQRFTQWWLWLINLFIISAATWTIYESYFADGTGDIRLDRRIYVLLFWLFLLLIPALFLLMRLETNIDRVGINIKFFPFLTRKFKWEDIQSFEVINYGFVGGWGIRLGTKYGSVYNVKGNKGLFLQLKNGKRLCIGTQQPEVLETILKQAEANYDL